VILTPIHLDHEAFLGNTVAKIAAEKAGIIKKQNQVVTGKQCPEAFRVIRCTVKKNRGFLWRAKPVSGISLGLAGDFQKSNAGIALKAAFILNKKFRYPISFDLAERGLGARNWKGRMESFHRKDRRLILDGAHNPLSVRELVRSLQKEKSKDPWLVFGAMNDKNSREMLKILSGYFSKTILTGMEGHRAKSVGMLAEEAKGLFKCVLTAQNIREAFFMTEKVLEPGRCVVITGSFYLVGAARRILTHA
jgi:dihydrofolate synthase/folylpolyglutamate synthase